MGEGWAEAGGEGEARGWEQWAQVLVGLETQAEEPRMVVILSMSMCVA